MRPGNWIARGKSWKDCCAKRMKAMTRLFELADFTSRPGKTQKRVELLAHC